jgi:hypothetical protein
MFTYHAKSLEELSLLEGLTKKLLESVFIEGEGTELGVKKGVLGRVTIFPEAGSGRIKRFYQIANSKSAVNFCECGGEQVVIEIDRQEYEFIYGNR